jgi:hypothetical protein
MRASLYSVSVFQRLKSVLQCIERHSRLIGALMLLVLACILVMLPHALADDPLKAFTFMLAALAISPLAEAGKLRRGGNEGNWRVR